MAATGFQRQLCRLIAKSRRDSRNAVLDQQGAPYRQGPEALNVDLHENAVVFHEGRIGGVWPEFREERPRRPASL